MIARHDFSPLDDLGTRSPYSWLRERDIDLLVCAEIHAIGGLTRLLANRIGAADERFEGAWVSHSEIDGESDLVVAFASQDGQILALIENKIAAAFQPDQGQRYAARARRWSAAPNVLRVATVLLAPADYMTRPGSETFDAHITYDEAATTLHADGDLRSVFLAEALEAGIEACRRGYVMSPDLAVSDMWRANWKTSRTVAPRLNMCEPTLKPGQSTWIYFREAEGFSAEDRKRAVVVYKANRGQADLQVAATEPSVLATAIGGLLDPSMSVAKAAKSASVRIAVPIVDFTAAPQEQEAAIVEGLSTCERLRALFVENRKQVLGALERSPGGRSKGDAG